MEMLILKSAACLALLMLFYKLLLEKENMHLFKRFYLLGALVVSAVIPFVTFIKYIEAPVHPVTESSLAITEVPSGVSYSWISVLLWSVYLGGVLIFGFIFLLNLLQIIRKIRRNEKIRRRSTTTVLLPEDLPPHTFWNYIFLNKQKFEKGQIPKEVFEHEEAHAVQKHTLDILFLELLQVFFWFNPLIYLVKKAVKLNHEFLADRAVLKNGTNTAIYQELLLTFSSGAPQNALINSINYSLIKKRFTVMKTRTSKTTSAVKGFLLLPLLALMLYSFSTRETVVVEAPPVEIQETLTPDMIAYYNKMAKSYSSNWEKNGVTFIPTEYIAMQDIYRKMTIEQKRNAEPFPKVRSEYLIQEVATPEMVMEYNNLAKFYSDGVTEEMIEEKGRPEILKEFKRLRYIYSLMTKKQKQAAEKMPPPPPPIEVTGYPGTPPPPKTGKDSLPPLSPPIEVMGYPSPQSRPAPPIPPAPEEGKIPPPPPPPPAPTVEKVGQMAPPPPPPPTPVEGVKKWIEEGAEFFYNGKAISGEEALRIVRKNEGKNLTVQVEENSSGKTVRISDK